MSPRIDQTMRYPAKNEAGERQCRECGSTKLGRGRRNWCSDECVDAFRTRAWPAHLRGKVMERDKGVCASCGFDTNRIAPWLEKLPRYGFGMAKDGRPIRRAGPPGVRFWHAPGRNLQRATHLLEWLWGVKLTGRKTYWDMDHAVPLAEGGSNTLANCQTLCRKCHRVKTAEQAARKARLSKKQMILFKKETGNV